MRMKATKQSEDMTMGCIKGCLVILLLPLGLFFETILFQFVCGLFGVHFGFWTAMLALIILQALFCSSK